MKLKTIGTLVLGWAMLSASAFAQTIVQEAVDRGANHYRAGRFSEAAQAFSEAVNADPGALDVWVSLGWAHRKGGRSEDARTVWTKVLKIDPARASLWNQLATIDIENEQWSEAARFLEESLGLEPSNNHVRLRLAATLERAGRLDAASDAFEELVRREPDSLTTTKRLASFYERAGDDARALRTLETASRRLPHYAHIFRVHVARLLARQADRAMAAGDVSGAVAGYREAVGLNPRDAGYQKNLGWAHRRSGELTEAVDVWRSALDRDATDAKLMRHLADALRESGDVTEARRLYRNAWAVAPGRDPVVPFRLAEDALSSFRHDEAVRWTTALLRMPDADEIWSERIAGLFARFETPEPAIAVFRDRGEQSTSPERTASAESRLHALVGLQARRSGDLDRAVRSYHEALRRDPANRIALRDLGWTHWLRSDWTECATTWERLSVLDPTNVAPLNLLTHLHLYRHDYERAIRSASASLALQPAQPDQRLKLARALHWSGRYVESKAMAEDLALANPDHLEIQRFWAELLMQYHDFSEGLSTWKRVLALGGADPRAEFYYVKSLYETGRYDEALAEGRQLAQADNAHHGLLRLLADDALLRADQHGARAWLERLRDRVPNDPDIALELAAVDAERGDIERALETIDHAQASNPTSVDLATTRANLLRRSGRGEAAFAVYRDLAAQYPENREVFVGYFQTASETGRTTLALTLLEANRGTFLKPYEVELERARLLYVTGHQQDALHDLQTSAQLDRDAFVLPALLYHGLGNHSRTPAMPVERFESQMRVLAANGYQALSVPELDRISRGTMPAPERPILISFDDARIDSFELADPILERYGLKATMFVPTGLTIEGHPFFADWGLLQRFASNGRWDIQAHGHRAHDPIVIGADGTEGSFLVNREWLPKSGRLETESEYLRRIDDDYQRVKAEIEARIPDASVVGYAFPFSEAGQENSGNYPNATVVNEGYLSDHYRFGFIQDANGYNELVSPGSPFLKRYSVPRDFDGDRLLRHLANHHPRARALRELAKMKMWVGLYGRARHTWATLLERRPILADDAAFYLASIDYQRGSLRDARTNLEAAKQSVTTVRPDELARLDRRISWAQSFKIEPRFSILEDSAHRSHRGQGVGFSVGGLHPLEIRGVLGSITFAESSFVPFEAAEGDLGARVRASPHLYFDGRVRRRVARTTGPDSTNYWAAVGIEGDRGEFVLRALREDVDTLRARREDVALGGYQLQHLFRVTPRLWVFLDGRYGEYTDGNVRADVVGRVTVRPWSAPEWRIGMAAGWTDNRVQSSAYYTPEQLRFGRGRLSYSKSLPSGWNIDTAVELGWGRDTLRGDRFTAYVLGRAVQAWTTRVRSSVGWNYSSSPGYRSWSLTMGLHYGFGPPVEIGQSRGTTQ